MIAERPDGNTYWVQPGRLLAGEYPGAQNGDESITRLRRYLDAGIDSFIDLTEEGELEPYEDRLNGEAAARGKKVEYELFAAMDKAAFRRSPETVEQEHWVRTWREPERPIRLADGYVLY
jgi:hypothetical protein